VIGVALVDVSSGSRTIRLVIIVANCVFLVVVDFALLLMPFISFGNGIISFYISMMQCTV